MIELSMKRLGYRIPPAYLIKSENEIDKIRKSAKITKEIVDKLEGIVCAGMTTKEIDEKVYEYAVAKGAIPATIGYHGYKHSSCISINEVVCHGIPDERVLCSGDVVNIDITMKVDNYFSDASRMYTVGQISDKAAELIACTKRCLELGIESIKPYQPLNVIGDAIEPYAMSKGYSVVRDLTGHGIGKAFHEEPAVYHFSTSEKGMLILPGMVFTVEPMINEKGVKVKTLSDGWTVTTVDGGLSAQWEHTVLVTEMGVEILTR